VRCRGGLGRSWAWAALQVASLGTRGVHQQQANTLAATGQRPSPWLPCSAASWRQEESGRPPTPNDGPLPADAQQKAAEQGLLVHPRVRRAG